MSERAVWRRGRSRARALPAIVAALGLLATLGGPLVAAALTETPAEYCCRRGRCCCGPQVTSGTSCVRAACGCGRSELTQASPTLRPGVVVTRIVAAPPPASAIGYLAGESRTSDVLRRPPLPPPRLHLPSAATA